MAGAPPVLLLACRMRCDDQVGPERGVDDLPAPITPRPRRRSTRDTSPTPPVESGRRPRQPSVPPAVPAVPARKSGPWPSCKVSSRESPWPELADPCRMALPVDVTRRNQVRKPTTAGAVTLNCAISRWWKGFRRDVRIPYRGLVVASASFRRLPSPKRCPRETCGAA